MRFRRKRRRATRPSSGRTPIAPAARTTIAVIITHITASDGNRYSISLFCKKDREDGKSSSPQKKPLPGAENTIAASTTHNESFEDERFQWGEMWRVKFNLAYFGLSGRPTDLRVLGISYEEVTTTEESP